MAGRTQEKQTLTGAARDAAAERRSARRAERRSGPTMRISVRLEPDDLAALERRADLLGLTPSALARNLLRYGLTSRTGHDVDAMVGELEVLAARMRSAVS